MKERTLGLIFLAVGAACGVSFILLPEGAPLAAELALKLAPTVLMCAWMLVKGVDAVDIFILVGLVFSLLCDLFMALPDSERFTLFGMGSNALGLIFYTAYFIRTDPSLDIKRLIPPSVLMGIFFLIMNPNLAANRWPVLGYCVLYAVFLWRASARIGDPDIDPAAQIASYAGSMILAGSDCVLGLTVFGLVPEHPAIHASVMVLWWTGLVLLMATADIKTAVRRVKAASTAAGSVQPI